MVNAQSLHDNSKAVLALARSSSMRGKKLVFVSGNFNVVHPGHLRLLRFAKDCGDFLIVGVHYHDPGVHLLPEHLRLESVQSIGFVDHAFILRDPVADFIGELKPAVVVKGKEREERENPERAVVESYGGKLLFSSGDTRFSSLDLLRREFLETNQKSISKPSDFPKRHGFSGIDLAAALKKFNGVRVTVVGDLIVDEYVSCDPLGMSQEDPTIVVTPIASEKFVGGAGIVAAHAKGLGADVQFISVVGKDESANFARNKLKEFGVQYTLLEDESRPTTLKQRFRADGKTLLRVSHLRQHEIPKSVMMPMITAIEERLENTDLLIFSDFNYGCLPQILVDSVMNSCKKKGIMMTASCQSSSQVGDVSRFRDAALLCGTEREMRLAMRDFNSGLVVLAANLRKKCDAKNVVVTLGAEGLLIDTETDQAGLHTDRLPAFNTAPRDTAGAGDSLLTTASLAFATGSNVWISSYLGSIAAACQVGRLGNMPLTLEEIGAELGD